MRRSRAITAVAALLLAVVACTPSTGTNQPAQSRQQAEPARVPGRTMVVAVRVEPTSLAPAVFREPGVTFQATPRFFNAGVALLDQKGLPTPYLAEALPQLNTESW